jgi:thymidylate synthase ThyX
MKLEIKPLVYVSNGGVTFASYLIKNFPKALVAQLNKHRALSNNIASSRAIPNVKFVQRVEDNYWQPNFALNQKGMSPGEQLSPEDQVRATAIWERLVGACLEGSRELAALGVHKQWANRPLDWCANIDIILSGTDWKQFKKLRSKGKGAQDEIAELAELIKQHQVNAVPMIATQGSFFGALLYLEDYAEIDAYVAARPELQTRIRDQLTGSAFMRGWSLRNVTYGMVSAARCARTSYMNHENIKSLDDDFRLAFDLLEDKHMTPFEHQVIAAKSDARSGNIRAFHQLRKSIIAEDAELT